MVGVMHETGRRFLVRAGFLTVLSMTACAHGAGVVSTPTGVQPADRILDRIYFGRLIGSSGMVTDGDWETFLAEVVTPRFPEGLTTWHAQGQWRDSTGTVIREQSFLLEIIHPATPGADRAVRDVMAEYKHRFKQEAVLRVRTPILMEIGRAGSGR